MNLRILLSFIFIFFLHFLTNAQPKLVEAIEQIWIADSTKWRNSGRATYEYDGDLLVSELEQYWFTARSDWGNADGADYFYDEKGRLEKEILNKYQAGTNDYQNLYTNTYHYNENGCLVAEWNELVSIHGPYTQHYYEYTVDENCHITKRLHKALQISGDTTYKKNHYVNDAEGHVKIDSQYAFFNDEWQLHYERFFDYDEAGSMTEALEYLLFSNSTISETETWKYDEYGELTLRIKSRKTNSNPYREISKDSISLKYDNQNRVIQRRRLSYRFDTPDPPELERFTYYCDDVLKASGLDDLPRIFRTSYEYDIGLNEDCIDDLEDKSITIFPNPVMDELTIDSDLLSGEQTKIYIYDALGRQFLEQEFSILFDKFSVDVSNLERGFYFLTIENGDRIWTTKMYKN